MTEQQLPTAEEFLDNYLEKEFGDTFVGTIINASQNNYSLVYIEENIRQIMHDYAVLFAKHHVQEALKEASKQAKLYVRDDNEYPETIDSDSILNAYNLDKII